MSKEKSQRSVLLKKPKRSYKAVIKSLRAVTKITLLGQEDAICSYGKPSMLAIPKDIFKVVVWNLYKGSGAHSFENDFSLLLHQSDLFLAQEALLSPRGFLTFLKEGFQVIHAASYQRKDGVRDGVMTISKVKAQDDLLTRILCINPEPIFKTPKVTLVSCFPLAESEHPLLVINTHATLIRTPAKALDEIQNVLSRLPIHEGPAIFAGDFNTFTPKYLKVIEEELFRFGFEHVKISNDPRKYAAKLDHVFVKNLEVINVNVETHIQTSDHFPISLSLKVK